MKIYKPEPTNIIRLQISQQGQSTEYISFCETTQQDVMEFIKNLIEAQKLSVFQEGKLTRLDFRQCVGGKNGKSKSLSFKGLSPKETLQLILNKFQ